tara:strand:+ start:12891 stop:15350 length:2460 start_codon:yes stop_codon:yes gene_type:complete
MKKNFILPFLFVSFIGLTQTMHKQVDALRTVSEPKIDGYLEPRIWTETHKAIGWTQKNPINGLPERKNQKSEVQFLFNDKSLFVGAQFYDSNPDSILTEYSLRDETNKNCDWFGIWISPYNDAQNNFMFAITAAGVQLDARSTGEDFDFNWDAVWSSEVKINEIGWSVELEIPYSALRIPNTQSQEWGINMTREIRRTREQYTWNPIDISISNESSQSGILNGITSIDPPLRLSIMPYLSSYLDFFESDKTNQTNGGLDLKYGINESFTLDMTLVPDFGQTVFDDQILNVGPFEIQFNENRSFFTEGTELFNKGKLFYSRRIGDRPKGVVLLSENEILKESPTNVQLINASKISGRNSKGLGIGIFNGLTNDTYALIEDTMTGNSRNELIEPMSNYNVLVLDKVLKNNSFITFTNTNVRREGQKNDANVEKLQIQIGTKENSYRLYGDIAFSHTYDLESRSDGFASQLFIEKSSGNFRFLTEQSIESKSFNINDLGFNYNNNELNHSVELSYNIFTPIGKLRKAKFEFGLSNNMLCQPNLFTSRIIYSAFRLHNTNFFSSGINFEHSIGKSYDYFEARTNDLENVFSYGPSLDLYWWNSSDYRKRFAGDLGFGYEANEQFSSKAYQIRWSPRFRVNNHMFMTYVISYKNELNNVGRAFDSNYNNLEDNQENILFSKRDRRTITNVFKASYVINNKISFNLKLRHYWSTLTHKNFFGLDNGNLTYNDFSVNDTDGNPQYDINYNTWNIDLNCIWRFAPGSEMNLQWKNSISSIGNNAQLNPQENFQLLFDESQGNSLSLRLVYFLDYQYLKRLKPRDNLK